MLHKTAAYLIFSTLAICYEYIEIKLTLSFASLAQRYWVYGSQLYNNGIKRSWNQNSDRIQPLR